MYPHHPKTMPPRVGSWFIRVVPQLCQYAKWRGKYMLNLKALFLLVYLDTFRWLSKGLNKWSFGSLLI